MAGTWADVLSRIELINNELECGLGEDDEATALLACVDAQHQFESLAATYPRVLGSVITSSSATALTETTTFPSSLLRLDGMFVLDANGRVIRKIEKLQELGAHAPGMPWPLNLIAQGSGAVAGYWSDMANFYWLPLPDATVTLRIHGLFEKAEPTLRTATFDYPNRCKLAMAQFATFLMKFGVDDAKADLDALGQRYFAPLMKSLSQFDRSVPLDRHYDYPHTT